MTSKLLKALQGIQKEKPPIWMMRQAGRYLPEYKELRKRQSFYEMSHQVELAVEVTLMPFRHFPLDAAIIFSDILTLFEAWNIQVEMVESIGPKISSPLHTPSDLNRLPITADLSALEHVYVTIKELKKQLSVPLLGFCGAPLTLASYLIEGGSSPDLKKTRLWMQQDAASFHLLLEKLCQLAITHLKGQINAGADAVQIFDSWACHLSDEEFNLFCAPYHQKMVKAIEELSPVILFTRGSDRFLDEVVNAQPTAISIDWSLNLSDAFKRIPQCISLQGNLDPHLLLQDSKSVKVAVENLLKQVTEPHRYIFNLGHGVLPCTPLENIKQIFESVDAWKM